MAIMCVCVFVCVCLFVFVCVCVCARARAPPHQAHLRSTELENTKLSAELQMLKAVELNREVTIAQFQEELERMRACLAQRDGLEKELHNHQAHKVCLGPMCGSVQTLGTFLFRFL